MSFQHVKVEIADGVVGAIWNARLPRDTTVSLGPAGAAAAAASGNTSSATGVTTPGTSTPSAGVHDVSGSGASAHKAPAWQQAQALQLAPHELPAIASVAMSVAAACSIVGSAACVGEDKADEWASCVGSSSNVTVRPSGTPAGGAALASTAGGTNTAAGGSWWVQERPGGHPVLLVLCRLANAHAVLLLMCHHTSTGTVCRNAFSFYVHSTAHLGKAALPLFDGTILYGTVTDKWLYLYDIAAVANSPFAQQGITFVARMETLAKVAAEVQKFLPHKTGLEVYVCRYTPLSAPGGARTDAASAALGPGAVVGAAGASSVPTGAAGSPAWVDWQAPADNTMDGLYLVHSQERLVPLRCVPPFVWRYHVQRWHRINLFKVHDQWMCKETHTSMCVLSKLSAHMGVELQVCTPGGGKMVANNYVYVCVLRTGLDDMDTFAPEQCGGTAATTAPTVTAGPSHSGSAAKRRRAVSDMSPCTPSHTQSAVSRTGVSPAMTPSRCAQPGLLPRGNVPCVYVCVMQQCDPGPRDELLPVFIDKDTSDAVHVQRMVKCALEADSLRAVLHG